MLGVDPLSYEHIISTDNLGNIYYTSDENYALTLAKFDNTGNLLWTTLPAYDSGEYSTYSVAQYSGGEYVEGQYRGKIAFGNDTLSAGASIVETFLVKYNSSGTAMWVRQPSGAATHNCVTVACDNVGDAYIAGYFDGTLVFGLDTLPYEPLNYGVFLVKYSQNGNVLWARAGTNLHNAANAVCNSVATDSAGNVFISGCYYYYLVFGADTLPKNSSAHVNAFAAKFDPSGNLKWLWAPKMPNGWGASNAFYISADNNGGAYIAGQFSNGTLTVGSITLGPITGEAPFFAKLNSIGNVSWAKQCFELDKNWWEPSSLSCDYRSNGYLLLKPNYIYTRRINKISIDMDTFELNPDTALADVIIKFDSSGNVKCGNIFSEGNEND